MLVCRRWPYVIKLSLHQCKLLFVLILATTFILPRATSAVEKRATTLVIPKCCPKIALMQIRN